jgi:small subunit ribosomal protein S21
VYTIHRRESGVDRLSERVIGELVQVVVKPGESIDAALKRFKKAVMNSGITKEARMHERYEKPSDRRRRELKASIRKVHRAQMKAAAKERD